jgi:hypothetical protein
MRAKFPGMQRGDDGVWRFSKPPAFPLLFSVQVRKPEHNHNCSPYHPSYAQMISRHVLY